MAHPRVGGENVVATSGMAWAIGSSPRGRGKRDVEVAHAELVGLIPARAGKTTRRFSPGPPGAAHPRVGGENACRMSTFRSEGGSSPRGRGKRQVEPDRCAWRRLIPAWAGKTRLHRPTGRSCRAHPRVGGENYKQIDMDEARAGSSPRGRGKPSARTRSPAQRRLIPAWAGKTSSLQGVPARATAHPRVGGENWVARRATCPSLGSSPRGRGKPEGPRRPHARGGLIPAWAGKTHPPRDYPQRSQAHPRVGGENRVISRRVFARRGSSPRGRGKQAIWLAS